MLLALAIHCVASGATSDAKHAPLLVADVVRQTGRTGGLVVLLDNGDTAVANAFLKRPQFLLQTLASTEARYLQLRDHVRALSKDSRATAMAYAPGQLPYADGEQNLNALFAEAHPDAVLVIQDKVDEQRVPGKQRLWVWGAAGFLD
jgi:hypothetical protein